MGRGVGVLPIYPSLQPRETTNPDTPTTSGKQELASVTPAEARTLALTRSANGSASRVAFRLPPSQIWREGWEGGGVHVREPWEQDGGRAAVPLAGPACQPKRAEASAATRQYRPAFHTWYELGPSPTKPSSAMYGRAQPLGQPAQVLGRGQAQCWVSDGRAGRETRGVPSMVEHQGSGGGSSSSSCT